MVRQAEELALNDAEYRLCCYYKEIPTHNEQVERVPFSLTHDAFPILKMTEPDEALNRPLGVCGGDGGDEFDVIGGEGSVDGTCARKDGGRSIDQK
jgi:hypothetical protein